MSRKLDPAFEALLADPRLTLRRPPLGIMIDQLRAAANAFMARAPLPAVLSSVDRTIETAAGPLRLRLIRPSDAAELPVLLFIHGGGFILGNLDTHESLARSLARSAQALVVAVDYRLSPEHPYPAALEDCLAALGWVAGSAEELGIDPTRVAIAGDSAGGQLAAAAALRSRDAGPGLRHLGLFYPLLDPRRRSESSRSLADGYMLTGEFIDWAWESYAGPADDPSINLLDAPLGELPPTSIVAAQYDPLVDEGAEFAARIGAAGVEVGYRCYPGMIHGFAGLPHIVAEAGEAIGWMGRRIRTALGPQG